MNRIEQRVTSVFAIPAELLGQQTPVAAMQNVSQLFSRYFESQVRIGEQIVELLRDVFDPAFEAIIALNYFIRAENATGIRRRYYLFMYDFIPMKFAARRFIREAKREFKQIFSQHT